MHAAQPPPELELAVVLEPPPAALEVVAAVLELPPAELELAVVVLEPPPAALEVVAAVLELPALLEPVVDPVVVVDPELIIAVLVTPPVP